MASETDTQASTNSESGLFGTPVTLEHIENKIQEVLHTSAKFGPDVATSQFGHGQGFLSVMVRVKPDWQGEKANELPTSLVIKIPSTITAKAVTEKTNWKEKVQETDPGMNFDMDAHFKAFETVLRMVSFLIILTKSCFSF